MLFSTPFILFFLAAILQKGNALPQGAPKKICQSMMPYHGGGIPPQEDASPFNIRLRRHNDGKILVTIASPIRSPFQGFMLQARTPFGNLMGGFDPGAQNHIHTIDCADFGDTLTHSNTDRKDQVEVEWLAPEDYDGPILFNATIAQSYNTFWVGVESQTVQVGKRYAEEPIPDVGPGFAGNGPSSTTPPNFRPEVARESSTEFDPFYTGCASSKLCFGSPDGCLKSKNCKAAVAVTVMGDKYDFELKATGDPAWVGVGLSDDTKMGDDSVIECAKRSNGAAGIGAYMSWTSAPPAGYAAERLSNPRLGVQLLNSSLIDGVMYCKVRRDARTTVRGKVFDLLNDQFYLLIAAGTSLKPGGVGFHDITFLPSGSKQALSDTATVAGASKLLIRLHGSFMLAAWIGTTSIGILLARYYRTTWVGSTLCGKDLWFAWHRMFMILTWSLTMTAFILIFVEIGRWTDERTNPHAILGTVTTILCFLQPIGAYFRPHPGTPKRQIFNWLHWLGGNAAHIIAIVTIFYAVKLTKAELPEFVIYILAAYVAFHVVVHLVLSIMGCVSEKSSERRVSSFPMKDLGGSGRSSAYADRNADSAYSNFRKFVLAIYIVVILALVIALIVIAAIPTIGQYWTEWRNSMNS